MLAIQKTKEIATYLRRLYTAEVLSTGENVPFPNLPIDMLEECRYAAKVIAQAVANESESPPL